MPPLQDDTLLQWFVMRDLKRANARVPAYKLLKAKGMEVFTPLKRRMNAKKQWEDIPLIHGLLFVHESRKKLNPVVEKLPTLQYPFSAPSRNHSSESAMPLGWAKAVTGQTVHHFLRSIFLPVLLHTVFRGTTESSRAKGVIEKTDRICNNSLF